MGCRTLPCIQAGECLSLREKRALACRRHTAVGLYFHSLAPYDPSPERFKRTVEDNGDAHHKLQVTGRGVVVVITAGKLDFGSWEQIFYDKFDGRRPKHILIKVLGE
jgi:thiamine phosphate synthase YjbQ (UPF0047 family)